MAVLFVEETRVLDDCHLTATCQANVLYQEQLSTAGNQTRNYNGR